MKARLKFTTTSTLLLVLILAISLSAAAPSAGTSAGKPPTATPGGPTPTPGGGGGGTPLSITVNGTQIGITQQLIGANEGSGRYNISEITELGLKNYRMYGGTGRYEPVDDNGAYGSPSIDEIKANVNAINWAAWDTQFNRSDGYFWALYPPEVQVSSATILADLKNNAVPVVMVVRPRDNHNTASWMNALPITAAADRNEWWEHVFAMVYQVNVRNNWGVDRWEVHNEPNQNGQGWSNNGGSQTDYYEFVRLTSDAINYVYATYLGNRAHYIQAPGVSGNPNRTKWVPGVLDNVDSYFNVFDYHWYGNNQDDIATGYIADLQAHNPDGVIEPMWNSEYGTYNESYNTVSQALLFSDQLWLMNLPASYVSASSIFSMYQWGGAEGLVADNGTKSETFWAFKTLLAALQSGKNSFQVTGNGTSLKILGTKDASGFYIAVLNRGTGSVAYSLTANISAHRTTGTGTLTEYSAANKAVVVANPTVSSGVVTFNSPANSLVVLKVP